MNIKTTFFASAALTAAMLISGCAKFEYTGREFASIPADESVAWYTPGNPVPAGKYRIIGRGELTFDNGELDSDDIEERLLDEARRRGADAVMLQSITAKKVGSYEANPQELPGPALSFGTSTAILPNGDPVEINSFGELVPLTGESKKHTVTSVRATFYKESGAVQKLIDEQAVQLLKLEEKAPGK